MFHTIPGSRLTVPTPGFAWVLIILGAILIVIGTAGAMKVRRHMMDEAGNFFELVLMRSRETFSYLLHDYDEPDKFLILLGFVGRIVGGLLILWAGIGLFVA
ncbi:MAG TPA: hypothetical protein PLX06_03780 [Fimbriimonadaceae bacterium]|nr:hypothetical protein [Fimbriimonadaceae bacterium]